MVLFKLIGAYLGAQVAMFFHGSKLMGLAVGLVLGHCADAWLHIALLRSRARRYWRARFRAERDDRFLVSTFSMLGKLCEVDGPLNKPELELVGKLTTDVLKLKRGPRKQALQIFGAAGRLPSSFQYDAAQFYELYQNDPATLQHMIEVMLRLAAADGTISPAEEQLVHSAAHIFGIGEEIYVMLLGRYGGSTQSYSSGSRQQSYSGEYRGNGKPYSGAGNSQKSIDDFYKVLGCTPSDPVDVIKQKYRKLVNDYHPDKIVSKDLPEDFMKFANEKFKSIQEAYEAVKAQKRFQ